MTTYTSFVLLQCMHVTFLATYADGKGWREDTKTGRKDEVWGILPVSGEAARPLGFSDYHRDLPPPPTREKHT